MLPSAEPWKPADYGAPEHHAIIALANGTATPDQQQRAMAWIHYVCGTTDLSYRPGSDRDTAFAEGKRWVGLQIRKLEITNPAIHNNEAKDG